MCSDDVDVCDDGEDKGNQEKGRHHHQGFGLRDRIQRRADVLAELQARRARSWRRYPFHLYFFILSTSYKRD